ncbi:MAG: AAA family ATPase, partial [Blastocatellia bacterium]
YYEGRLARPIVIEPLDALASFQSLLTAVRLTPHRLYLLIDEYDNFANEILMSALGANQQHYESLLGGTGALKTVFKAVKAAAAGGGLDRVFITGVAPLVMTDLSSGYNVAQSIHLSPHFAGLCGFTEAEISQALNSVAAGCGLAEREAAEALTQMRLYYNGYRFAEGKDALIYNPTLTLYFLQHFQENCRAPKEMLDDNLAMDPGKLGYLAALPSGAEVVMQALNDDASLSANLLVGRFGVQDVRAAQQDVKFMVSLFYFLGMLTLSETNAFGDLPMRIPNLVIRKLYLERLQESLLPVAADQIASRQAAQHFQRSGDLQPLCDFIEQRYFKVFSNRDYLHANELTIKTAFLTLLFSDVLYIMDSETPAGRRYADLTLIVRPDARQYQIFDLLLECKFIKLGDLGLSGEAVRALSHTELAALPLVKQKLAEARAQAPAYRREVEQRYQSMMKAALRLRTFAVVALGFDRLVWEEVPA